jgi:hypothetical protein
VAFFLLNIFTLIFATQSFTINRIIKSLSNTHEDHSGAKIITSGHRAMLLFHGQ